jgi:hypothetical protein
MAHDSYTRGVLTVIALCLLWLCATTAGWPVQARQSTHGIDSPVQPVVVVGWGTMDAKGRTMVTMLPDRSKGLISDPNIPIKVMSLPAPVDVRLEYSAVKPLPVGLTAVSPAGEWAPIRSAVEPEPVRPKPGGR